MIREVNCSPDTNTNNKSVAVINDGQARVIADQTVSSNLKTLTSTFSELTSKSKCLADQIDLVFDHYDHNSIKAQTQDISTKGTKSLHGIIHSGDVPFA